MSFDSVGVEVTIVWHTGRWSDILAGLEVEIKESLDFAGDGRYAVEARVFPRFILCDVLLHDQTLSFRSIVSQLKAVASSIVKSHHDPLPVPYVFSRYVYIRSGATYEAIALWLEQTARDEGGQGSGKARAAMQKEKVMKLFLGDRT